ncbi:MAG: aldose 1-epimerase [Acidimicrobiia bacterium]|nr:aldose 1-epimerase [Acidimicrobiia bacterium]
MELASGRATAVVDLERGGRLASLAVDGHELLVTEDATNDPMRWGCYPMVPWAGRVAYGRFEWNGKLHQLPVTLGPHAIHGTGYVSRWRQVADDRIDAELGDPWPWSGWVESSFDLDDERFRWTLTVTNLDRGPFPVTAGWHPWFRRLVGEREAELSFTAGAMLERDDAHIPTGRVVEPTAGPWDDCFADVDQPIRLAWSGGPALELRSDCSHWVVYTEPEHALCVEPQSAAPDAFNRPDCDVVGPSGSFERWFEVRWST